MSFEFLGLSEEVLRAVADAGYKEPTPIQRQAIPAILQGRDILGIAQTGTGKTASFTLPMIDILSVGQGRARMPRTLILEPTRELADQVAENFKVYGKYQKLTMALLIGGVSMGDQEKLLDRGVDVLIVTPGRLLDHLERGRVMLSGVEIVVIDEADRMLDMGFIPDIERIMAMVPAKHQTLFFSATMPPEIKRLTDQFLRDPKVIEVARPASAAQTITQALVHVQGRDKEKRAALRSLIDQEKVKNAIIFCNRKRDVQVVYKSLQQHGYNVGQLHGDMDQSARMDTLAKFRAGEIQLLVASDVAARGLDIPDVSHVFNFDVPIHADDYVHRIGRTGRAGRQGASFTLATGLDTKYVAAIERLIGTKIPVAEGSAPASPEPAQKEPVKRSPAKRETARKDTAPARKVKPASPDKEAPPTFKNDSKPAPKPSTRQSESPRQGKPARPVRDDDRDQPVRGMGDHMPAFLTRGFGSVKKAS